VIAGGDTDVDGLIEAAAHLQPSFYAGAPDFLKVLLDAAQARGRDLSCLRAALVSGAALSPDLRAEFFSRGIEVRQAYATAELGVIAYESAAADGLIVNEGVIVEIVKPGTGEPVAPGEVGEVVVTRLNGEYPLTRYATGDLSAILPGPSPCGRTNMRLRGLLGRAEQAAKAADAPVRKVSRARPAGATPVAAQE
jgi:phenylacetate-CoA ligase